MFDGKKKCKTVKDVLGDVKFKGGDSKKKIQY